MLIYLLIGVIVNRDNATLLIHIAEFVDDPRDLYVRSHIFLRFPARLGVGFSMCIRGVTFGQPYRLVFRELPRNVRHLGSDGTDTMCSRRQRRERRHLAAGRAISDAQSSERLTVRRRDTSRLMPRQ